MANWIKLPDKMFLNVNQIGAMKVKKITNPRDQYTIMAMIQGNWEQIVTELKTAEAAEQVIEGILQTASSDPEVVSTNFGSPARMLTDEKNYLHG